MERSARGQSEARTSETQTDDCSVALRFSRVLAREVELGDAEFTLAPVVRVHIDDDVDVIRAARSFMRWLVFMRRAGVVRRLTGSFEEPEAQGDGVVVMRGRWHGRGESGESVSSHAVWLRCRVQDGRIQELWTSRRIFRFMFGEGVGSWLGFWWLWVRFRLWSWRWRWNWTFRM